MIFERPVQCAPKPAHGDKLTFATCYVTCSSYNFSIVPRYKLFVCCGLAAVRFDLPFPNPKSAEITQQPRHGARVGGQPSAPPPLCAPWARQWISHKPIQAGPVPSAPSISQLLLPPLSGRRFFFYRRSRGGDSGTMARRAREWCAPWCSPEDQPSAHPGGP